jgi:hypothetical protein
LKKENRIFIKKDVIKCSEIKENQDLDSKCYKNDKEEKFIYWKWKCKLKLKLSENSYYKKFEKAQTQMKEENEIYEGKKIF